MKCLYPGCKAKAIDGMRELLDASSQDFPDATVEGDCISGAKNMKTRCWNTHQTNGEKLTAIELSKDSC